MLEDPTAGERKPTVAESFEKLAKVVEKYDGELVKGWRDDIDTLLVFAGLFSAVVTAFLIESHQKLEEDPADKTVFLLEQLVSFQRNASLAPTTDPIPTFQPDASTIRINCFWLLSLIFSLTSALFGLLCKQWVREFQRDTPTSTPAEALALRQLRRDSFEKWNVPAFLAALPILLEIALLFFFAGLLDLLWGLHRVPFIVSLVAVGLSAGLYFITTLLPTLTIPKNLRIDIMHGRFERLSYQFICPYKSPQAWLFYQFVCKILRPLSEFWKSTKGFEGIYRKPAPALRYHIESPASDWSSFDLRVVRQYDQHVRYGGEDLFSLPVYQLRAYEWAVATFRDSSWMIPHLQNVLGTISPCVAMSAVLGHLDVALWTDVSKPDVDLAVRDPKQFQKQFFVELILDVHPRVPAFIQPAICQPEGIGFLFQHQYLMIQEDPPEFPAALEQMGLQTAGLHFVVPLSVAGRLWTHPDAGVRKRSLALLRLYEEYWKLCSSVENYDESLHRCERLAFICALAKHVNCTDRTSVLITSRRGQEFIRFIHNQIITQGIHRVVEPEWPRAIEKIREVGKLPSDYFAPAHGSRNPPLSLPTIRYSLETQLDVELDHDSHVPGSQRDGETSDSKNVVDIQIIGNPRTLDRVGDSGSSSVPGKGHTSKPAEGPLAPSANTWGDESADATRRPDTELLVEAMAAILTPQIVLPKGIVTESLEQDTHPDTGDPDTSEHTPNHGAAQSTADAHNRLPDVEDSVTPGFETPDTNRKEIRTKTWDSLGVAGGAERLASSYSE
ncbi:hypothetical protein VNI00_010803 [Paramarasmius palmivorus]|uniref:DUF6535 domain-containing protein n=1 Tax=Paramarasmius palmivorus TaxID=297713 RepID=A0AAW0CDK1_9AGAR